MAQVITVRRLVTEVVLKSAPAVKALAAYDRLWKSVAKGAQDAAKQVNAAAASMADTVDRMATSARSVGNRVAARGFGGGGGGVRRGGADPLDAAIGRSNRQAAREAGFSAGAKSITDASAALGRFASASDRAKAAVKDLEAQVARNRKEMADLRAQALKTGDADGTLAERVRGLSAANQQATVSLQGARKALREVDGGLIDTIKNVSGLKATTVALGNVLAAGFTAGARAVKDGLVGAAKGAVDFESSMADVKKVLSDKDLKNFDALNQGVLDLSKNIGIAPKEVAALTAALAQSGIAGDELLKTAEDASKLAVAFGISGDEAGQALAKLRTGLGLSRDEVNSLTGTINNLSNSMAATAPEITDAVQRVGSVAKAANISAQSTAALATAMIASGANAEVAATGTKNFIRALGSGAAATKKQREAFAALGLESEEVAARLVKGGKESEAAIKDVVGRIGQLAQADRLPVLIELFGSESIGAIGPLATNLDLLTNAFNIAGDAAAAAGSVEKEFAARSNTTASALAKLKANVEVLAIEAGNALLPVLTRVSEWLTSPEVQDFARQALAGLKDLVVSLVPYVSAAAEAFIGLGQALQTVAGYVGAVTSAGREFTAWLGFSRENAQSFAQETIALTKNLTIVSESLMQGRRALDAWSDGLVASADKADVAGRSFARLMLQLRGDAAALAEFDRKAAEADKRRGMENEAAARRSVLDIQRTQAAERSQDAMRRDRARRRDNEDVIAFDTSGGPGLAAARAGIAARKAAARKGHHKATKMDRQLAALDPALAGVLTRGGEADRGGDLMVHRDALSTGAFKAAAAHSGLGGVSGVGSVGPGPSITNVDNRVMVTIQQAIDARGNAPAADNLRSAGQEVASRSGEAVVKFTGANRVKALQNSGGRLTGA